MKNKLTSCLQSSQDPEIQSDFPLFPLEAARKFQTADECSSTLVQQCCCSHDHSGNKQEAKFLGDNFYRTKYMVERDIRQDFMHKLT